MKVTASATGDFEAKIKLKNAAQIALKYLSIEINPTSGKPKVKVSVTQNLNGLRLDPSVSLKASASITGRTIF